MNAYHKKTAIKITSKLEKIVQGVKITAFVLTMLILLSSVLWTGYSIKSYLDGHWFNWRSPIEIKLQAPLVITPKVSVQLPTPKKLSTGDLRGKLEGSVVRAGLSLEAQAEHFYQTIRFHESSNGKNTAGLNGYCINKGQLNEIGYAVAENYCFDDIAEQKATALLWYKNRIGKVCKTAQDCLKLYSNSSYSELL